MPVTDGGVQFGSHRLPVDRELLGKARQPGHRRRPPRGPRASPPTSDGLAVIVDVVEELGADAYIYATPASDHVKLEGGDDGLAKPFIARVDGRTPPEKGATIYLDPDQGHVHVFDAETGARLGD